MIEIPTQAHAAHRFKGAVKRQQQRQHHEGIAARVRKAGKRKRERHAAQYQQVSAKQRPATDVEEGRGSGQVAQGVGRERGRVWLDSTRRLSLRSTSLQLPAPEQQSGRPGLDYLLETLQLRSLRSGRGADRALQCAGSARLSQAH